MPRLFLAEQPLLGRAMGASRHGGRGLLLGLQRWMLSPEAGHS